ncbi:L-seryl-tRNA(Sec) selenium transferase [Anaeromyxobacter paludicola]|uniref:L-seryl-tRNA(Sec) selenium transferase n=2 Tax=Anaeromyxobacter paludicola TaxID=2918171 RepID=A0ABN6NCS4_9BACT|nr:L-seryl-tRNA(Sec) selenium transferase [Anaeromyxobacter paludicola]
MDDRPAPAAEELRKIPKSDRLLAAAEREGLLAQLGHEPVMQEIRALLDAVRNSVRDGGACPAPAAIEARLVGRLEVAARGSLRGVINATGILIHTNLGRSPLSEETIGAMSAIGRGYTNLEYSLGEGRRGDRYGHAADALRRLTGAEDALVVNNNAAAVMLALGALSGDRPADAGGPPEVIISRGQLVEIGGGFRIPDVLRRSGCALVEVGTTNRTYARDYEAAIGPRTAILLSVHRSNFAMSGFVHDAALEELCALGRARGLAVVDDLGSGTLLPTAPFGLGSEPTVPERVAAGADLVTFSGDKLLGGPQAGILVGRREAIARCRSHPLTRALRVDKVTLAGLSATLAHYERGEALAKIPIWRAIALSPEALAERAGRWREALAGLVPGASVREVASAVGGGSLPGVTLPSRALALPLPDPDAVAARLRDGAAPVVARIEEGALLFDPRTVQPGEDESLLGAIRAAVA